eukprot:Opistho-1_new@29347
MGRPGCRVGRDHRRSFHTRRLRQSRATTSRGAMRRAREVRRPCWNGVERGGVRGAIRTLRATTRGALLATLVCDQGPRARGTNHRRCSNRPPLPLEVLGRPPTHPRSPSKRRYNRRVLPMQPRLPLVLQPSMKRQAYPAMPARLLRISAPPPARTSPGRLPISVRRVRIWRTRTGRALIWHRPSAHRTATFLRLKRSRKSTRRRFSGNQLRRAPSSSSTGHRAVPADMCVSALRVSFAAFGLPRARASLRCVHRLLHSFHKPRERLSVARIVCCTLPHATRHLMYLKTTKKKKKKKKYSALI